MPASTPTDLKTLTRLFASRGITTDTPAFYNDPAFLAAERSDGTFLELYGAWVRARRRSAEYDTHVRRVVPLIAEIVAAEIARDGQLGTCIDAAMMLTKMFEEVGIWCYGAKGALTILNPALKDSTHFWMFDQTPATGHVWVVAPPFEIVDITLRTQPYQRGEEAMVPQTVITETAERISPAASDFFADSVLLAQSRGIGRLPDDIHLKLSPDLARAVRAFPSWQVEVGKTTLRYAAGGVTVSDGPSLHAIRSRRWNGLLAGELFDRLVKPALDAGA
jgi:hypothetical protein